MPKDIFELEGIVPKKNSDVLGDSEPSTKGGIYEDYIKPVVNYEAGLGLGMGEGLINSLSSIGNLAPEAYEKLTGNKTGRIPKVDLMQYAPEGEASKIGGMIGNPIGSIAAPGGAIMKGASKAPLINKLPELIKTLLGGAAAGGALGEGDRSSGALIGAGTAGAGSSVISLAKALKGVDLNQVVKQTQAKVNQAKDSSGKIFDMVENAVESKGISKVPVEPELIDQARSLLSKKLANKKLLEKAETGDFKALRKLQADLRKKGEKGLASDSLAENDLGEEILDVRDNINSAIQSHLENTGHKELADALNKARDDYRNVQETYFSSPALAKMFGKSQKVPSDPLRFLSEDSTEMNRFKAAHPEIEEALEKALRSQSANKTKDQIKLMLGIGGTSEFLNRAYNHYSRNN